MTISKRHELIRKGGNVERFHTDRMLFRQSVSQHSFNAALLAYDICETYNYHQTYSHDLFDSNKILKYMLVHDIAEQAVGDTPSFVKKNEPNLSSMLHKIEDEWFNKSFEDSPFEFFNDLNDRDKIVTKFCDSYECACTCIEEIKMGNSNFRVILDRCIYFLQSHIQKANNDTSLYDILYDLYKEIEDFAK